MSEKTDNIFVRTELFKPTLKQELNDKNLSKVNQICGAAAPISFINELFVFFADESMKSEYGVLYEHMHWPTCWGVANSKGCREQKERRNFNRHVAQDSTMTQATLPAQATGSV